MSQHIPHGAVDLSGIIQQPTDGSPTGAPVAPAAGQGQVIELASVITEANDTTFEQTMQLSQAVPVILDLGSPRSENSISLTKVLEKLVREQNGRLVLAKVVIDESPALARALQVQGVPTVLALIAGQPVPLFQGGAPEEQIRQVFTQLIQLAEQQGVRGQVRVTGEEGDAQPEEAPVNPAHLPAIEAIERGDYTAAIEVYEKVLTNAPADDEARAALAQVRLLHRLSGLSSEEIRRAAADNQADVEAQLRVADLDVSGGHIEDAFSRLLDLFSTADEDAQTAIREHLLDLFLVVGTADARVIAARGKLANLLF